MLTTLNILSPDQGKGLVRCDAGDRDLLSAEDRPADGAAHRQRVARAGRHRVLAAIAAAVLALPFTTRRRRASP